jgi:hypothetical protein
VNKGKGIVRIITKIMIFSLWILALITVIFVFTFSLSAGLNPLEGFRRFLLIVGGYFQVLFLPRVTIEGSFPLEISSETPGETFEREILFRSSIFGFPIIVEDIQITDVDGLNGTVICINQFPFEVSAFGDFKLRLKITLHSEIQPGRYWIRYKITYRKK